MTDKQLEKLGIHRDGGKLKPNRYWCNTTQTYMRLFKTETIEDILKDIFDEGIEQGIKEGKEQRSKQINGLLNNNDLF